MARSANKVVAVHAVENDMEADAASEAPIKMEAPAAAPAPVAVEAKPKKKGVVRKLILSAVAIGAIAGGAYYGHQYWIDGRFMIATDDAYIEGDITNISPKVTGYVAERSGFGVAFAAAACLAALSAPYFAWASARFVTGTRR